MTERKKFNVAIIGAGPGGYVAAIKAAQLGQSVALIEKEKLGGCCLNVGCIPTKALLANAAILQAVRHAKDFGISVGAIDFDYAQMVAKKDQIIAKIRASLENLLKANQITIIRGSAQFESATELKVLGEEPCLIEASKIIIATGSIPLDIPAFPCDHERILNSTSILQIKQLPKHICIVGGGYIGCEFASLFSDLGVKVTILEALPSILAAQGPSIASFMTKTMQSRGIDIKTNVKVLHIENQKTHVLLTLSDQQTIQADLALISVGRKIVTNDLHLEKIALAPNAKGAIETDHHMQTSVPGIYAIGDVTGQLMLAHVASHQGLVAAAHAAGQNVSIDYRAVPAVVFTNPEIATVGLTQEQAVEKGYQPIVGQFPFAALGKAVASMETQGFAQIVSDKMGQILGAQIVGKDASNLIAEMALAIQNELTLDSILETIHAHPTMAECWAEAAALANQTPIHMPPRVKR